MKQYCPYCSSDIEYCRYMIDGEWYCRDCNNLLDKITHWVASNNQLPTGDERQVLIKRDNGRGGYWIDIAWWRPSANCFDDGLSVDYWCEVPQ